MQLYDLYSISLCFPTKSPMSSQLGPANVLTPDGCSDIQTLSGLLEMAWTPVLERLGLRYLVNYDESFDFSFNLLASAGMISDTSSCVKDQIIIVIRTFIVLFSVSQILLTVSECSFFFFLLDLIYLFICLFVQRAGA